MRIEVAEHAGFCFGVKRAVDTVYQEIENAGGEKIYTYGPVVHNEEVVKDLEEKGVTVLQPEGDLPAGGRGTIILSKGSIRSSRSRARPANGSLSSAPRGTRKSSESGAGQTVLSL